MQYFGGKYLKKAEFADFTLPTLMAIPAVSQGLISEKMLYNVLVFSRTIGEIAKAKEKYPELTSAIKVADVLAEVMEDYNQKGVLAVSESLITVLVEQVCKLVDFAGKCTKSDINYGLNTLNALVQES